MTSYGELTGEARRVQESARSYKKGIYLSAIFRSGTIFKEVFYFNPYDIPLKIPYLYSWLYLYSVCPAENRKYDDTTKERDHQARFRIPPK